jgi:hypothetical protein
MEAEKEAAEVVAEAGVAAEREAMVTRAAGLPTERNPVAMTTGVAVAADWSWTTRPVSPATQAEA